jgi:hypothetical protein
VTRSRGPVSQSGAFLARGWAKRACLFVLSGMRGSPFGFMFKGFGSGLPHKLDRSPFIA